MIKPKLSFKGTYAEWEKKRIIDICQILDSKRKPISEKNRVSGPYPYYGANNIQDYVDDFIFAGSYILIAEDGGNFEDFQTRPIAQYVNGKFWVNNHAHILQGINVEDTKLIFYLCEHKDIRTFINGSTRGKLTQEDLKRIEITFPVEKSEKQKIAAFFTALDEKIRLSEQKLNLISKIKKGIAQKLFAQDLRFKNKDGYFFDSWKSYTVGELVDVIGGGTPSTQNPDYWDGDIYWLTPTEINSKYVHSSNRKITFDGVRNSSAKLLPKGALLLTTRATLGACSINNQDNPVCTNQGFQSLVCKDGVDNEFMYYVVTDSAFQKTMIQRASGSTFLEISSKNLKGIVIHLPSLEEQRQIATLLSSLDKKIDCLKQRVKALKTQKASFMQQMFV